MQVLTCIMKNVVRVATITPGTTTDSKIIEATIDLVGELGYKGTTTRQIAERAGVDEVTIFRRFGSKETLAKKAVGLAQGQLRNALTAAGREKTGDLAMDLINMALLMMQSLERRRESVVAIMFEAKREVFFGDATSGMVQYILRLVRDFLESYKLEKSLVKEEIEFITQSITSFVFYHVIVKERLLGKKFTSKNRKEEIQNYVGFLLRNVSPKNRIKFGV